MFLRVPLMPMGFFDNPHGEVHDNKNEIDVNNSKKKVPWMITSVVETYNDKNS